MKIFTTINPNDNYESQLEATKSWMTKYEVFSVNTSEEIESIKYLYPYINFIEAKDIYQYKNKKLIKLDAILDAMSEHGGEYSCFMNSDIILNNIDIKINERHLNNGIYISTRYENDNGKISKFVWGFDFFCIHKNYLNLFKNKDFAIGLPWWDYWVPICAFMSNLNIYHLDYELFYHKTHELNYDMKKWKDLSEKLYQKLIVDIIESEEFKFEKFITADEGVMNIKRFIDKKMINLK